MVPEVDALCWEGAVQWSRRAGLLARAGAMVTAAGSARECKQMTLMRTACDRRQQRAAGCSPLWVDNEYHFVLVVNVPARTGHNSTRRVASKQACKAPHALAPRLLGKAQMHACHACMDQCRSHTCFLPC